MWHALSLEKVFDLLETSKDGLSEEEAKHRLSIYGKNVIELKKKSILLETLKEQFSSPLVLLLIFATFLSFYIGEISEGFLIAFAIFLYIFFDYVQKFKSEQIISLIKRESETEVIVKREGKIKKIKSSYLVPGDIIILKQGDKVPADIRIISARNLYVDESILTGESQPVKKEPGILPEDTELSERKNMLYMGTYIVRGKAEGVVVATGNKTELGKMYKYLENIETKKTQFEKEIDKFGKLITVITVIIVLIVFILSYYLKIFTIYDAIIFSIALGVAVIPEGLPTVLTIVYTIGLYRIYKAGAVVKRLESVETLGSVDVIFTDKTGTLTLNQLTVREFWYNGKFYEVSGKGYSPKGTITQNGKKVVLDDIFPFIEACLNSTDTQILYENNTIKIVGDPLEAALIVLAYKAGLTDRLEVINVFEFDRERKRMSVVVKKENKYIAFIKGAPERIIEISKYLYLNDKLIPLERIKTKIEDALQKLLEKGYRVIAIGYKYLSKEEIYNLSSVENNIVLLGFIGMEDPIRENVKDAIEYAKKANIDVIIITGDHPETAKIVAKKLGLPTKTILAKEIRKKSDDTIVSILREVKIIARAEPLDKYRVVKAFKSYGYSVAMTGDGINDAAALKLADIGISFNEATDIAKEAADMILLKNGFKAIIEAIKEGRRVFYDLKSFLIIVLSVNIALLILILLSFFINKHVPLKATHILLINIALEAVNSIIIGTNKISEEKLFGKPPKKIVTKRFIIEMIIHGLILGLGLYSLYLLNVSPFSLVFYLALAQYAIFFYYQKKENILFTKNRWFYIAIAITLSIIILSSTVFSTYTSMSIPSIKELIKVVGMLGITYLLYYFIVQTVPEQHHSSANSDRHH